MSFTVVRIRRGVALSQTNRERQHWKAALPKTCPYQLSGI